MFWLFLSAEMMSACYFDGYLSPVHEVVVERFERLMRNDMRA